LKLKEVPCHKFSKEVLNAVKHGRQGIIITDYGKPYGILLPMPPDEE